ncbi:MAG: hypothetical protein AAF962_10320 [Actinomycetota bacterium]
MNAAVDRVQSTTVDVLLLWPPWHYSPPTAATMTQGFATSMRRPSAVADE